MGVRGWFVFTGPTHLDFAVKQRVVPSAALSIAWTATVWEVVKYPG
jgi:hypothetical protein